MKVNDFVKWNTRSAALYAFGVWTMIGGYGYMKYKGRIKDISMEEVEEPENPNRHVFQSEHVKAVIIKKENFVPYTTRLYRFINSFTGQTNAPQDSTSSSNCDGDATATRVD